MFMTAKRQPKWIGWQWTRTTTAKSVFTLSRWLHVYVSTSLLCLLLFFSITGFTLNHVDWFSGASEDQAVTHSLQPQLKVRLMQQDITAVDELQRTLSQQWSLPRPRSVELEWALDEITFDYSLPAGSVFVVVDIDRGELLMEVNRGGLIALLNDLHKGRHSGDAWSLLIDVSALLICVFSITGLAILLQHKRYRAAGLMAAISGLVFPCGYYFIFVPSVVL